MNQTPSKPTKYAVFVPRSLVLPTTQLFVDYREDALLFIHLIFRERIFKKRHQNEFIPLKMAYLRKQLTFDAARELIDGLIKAGIVEADQKFVIGHKSIGYRLRADLRDALHDRYILTDKFLIRRLQKVRTNDELSLPVHLALEKNMERLTLDWNAARQDVEAHYTNTISALRGIDSGSATRRRKKANRTRSYELHALDSWRNGETWFIPDRFGRCHTPLTSLSKRLRRYLTLDNDDTSLYEIDIINSQPLILGMLALHWTENNKTSFSRNESQVPLFIKRHLMRFLTKWEARYPTVITNTQPLTNTHSLPTPHQPQPTPTPKDIQYDVGFRNAPSDARTYLEICTEGRLYEVLAQDIARDKAKKMFFKTIFGRSIPESFRRRFPTIAEAAKWAKTKSYKDLSHLLQRTESKLMIDGVAAELIAEGRWVATIHDSVIVRKRDVKRAEQLIRYEFERWGVPARTKRTCLNVA